MTTTTARGLLPLLSALSAECTSEYAPGKPARLFLTARYAPFAVQRRIYAQLRAEYPTTIMLREDSDDVALSLTVQGVPLHIAFALKAIGDPVETVAITYVLGDGAL